MSYRIDPAPPGGGRIRAQPACEATIVLVGCGGSGGFLAEAIARLLIGRNADLYLIDHDRVEPHNLARQAFVRADVGRFKAEVLAERLARRIQRPVGYSVLPYDHTLHAALFQSRPSRLKLLAGAVDNAAARRSIAATLDTRAAYPANSCHLHDIWWLDCGNGRNAGQVLLGNLTRPEGLRGAFVRASGVCRALPAPSLQRPDLLDAPPTPQPQPPGHCAAAVAAGEQGGTINQVVAAIAAGYIEKLLHGTCTWMASYFDLDDGTLRCVPADPRTVAALTKLHLNAVAPPSAQS